jgi:hypothetical protein
MSGAAAGLSNGESRKGIAFPLGEVGKLAIEVPELQVVLKPLSRDLAALP